MNISQIKRRVSLLQLFSIIIDDHQNRNGVTLTEAFNERNDKSETVVASILLLAFTY